LEELSDWALLSPFVMIQTSTYLYSSNFTPHVKEGRNLSQNF